MQNRVIRLRDAPKYLGMNINLFNKDVRPHLPEVRIGIQGVAFDRLDLDMWFDDYKQRCERTRKPFKGGKPWDAKEYQALQKEAASGKSIKPFSEREYVKALERATSRKQKSS